MDNGQKENLKAFIAGLGLTYKAVFVPQSQSRNKGEKRPCINWEIKLSRGTSAIFNMDYMQGIGSIPKSMGKRLATYKGSYKAQNERQIAETGQLAFCGTVKKPDLLGILHCLVMEQSVLDHRDFESWASDYGYDTDSRTAEKVYQACLAQALQLKHLISESEFATLAELYQDY